jgi:hypothetical protein
MKKKKTWPRECQESCGHAETLIIKFVSFTTTMLLFPVHSDDDVVHRGTSFVVSLFFSLFNRHRTNPKIVNRFLDDDNVVRFHSVVHSHSRNQLKNSFEWKQQREKKSPERWDYVFNTGGPFCVVLDTNQTNSKK